MKKHLSVFVLFFSFVAISFAQQTVESDKFDWLMGEWRGKGSGQPGEGSGIFSFAAELDGNIIVRRSRTEFSATDNRPEMVHSDLLIVYRDIGGNPVKAIYFDNEGHTINYSVDFADRKVIFTSEKTPNIPTFRLTYSRMDEKMIHTKFEFSADGENFITHVEGVSEKIE